VDQAVESLLVLFIGWLAIGGVYVFQVFTLRRFDTSVADKRVCILQVTNLTDRAMELRCLVSASGSSQLFDLRCVVREKMIEYLRQNYPQSLLTVRLEMREANFGSSAPSIADRPSL